MGAPGPHLDEHIWAYLAKILREQGFDVIHVNKVDLIVTPDEEIMEYEVGEHRAIVTFNVRDFVPLTAQYYEDEKEHYGVVATEELSRGELQNGSRPF
ncbi:hypothetical protein ANAEL_03392 [Anaerolineales bacterium]|nr:hypothetical protein ANAEL_03392 [Anaerolineales bacterium]